MNNTAESNDILKELCVGQPLAVLATDGGSGPYVSLMAVAITPDLRQLYFATLRATRKWANLAGNHHVSILIDNRSNQVTNFRQAAAATILGIAEEVNGTELQTGLAIFLHRHPHLTAFTASPSCALCRVESFTVTAERIEQEGKTLYAGPAMLVWPCHVFHRIESLGDGSASLNFAVHHEGFDLRTNFNVYDLDPATGKYRVIRERFKDQL